MERGLSVAWTSLNRREEPIFAGLLTKTLEPEESRQLAEQAGGSEGILVPKSGYITNIQLPNEFHDILWQAIEH